MRSRMVMGATVALTLGLSVAAGSAAAQAPPENTPTPTPTPAPKPKDDKLDIAAPSRKHGARTARIAAPTYARPRPGSRKRGARVSTQTSWSGQPQELLVLDAATRKGKDWVNVLLPVRPNGSSGWIRRDRVVLGRTPYWVDVRLRARRITVYRNGKRARRFGAVIGAPGTPTPRGLAAIYERNRQPDPGAFLGPWALPLTSFSNVLENFGGGPGRVGIHGRAGASLNDPLGSARSHGCIRVSNGPVAWMAAKLPAGTPVDVNR